MGTSVILRLAPVRVVVPRAGRESFVKKVSSSRWGFVSCLPFKFASLHSVSYTLQNSSFDTPSHSIHNGLDKACLFILILHQLHYHIHIPLTVSECDNGTFGIDCSERCYCADNAPCNKTTGLCPAGCELGYIGDYCHFGKTYLRV